jgi:valyl-tRNA synthetase
LWTVLEGTMRLLHPIMPHITEEIWQSLPHQGESIVVASWPESNALPIDEDAEARIGTVMAVVRAIRSIRADLGLPPAAQLAPMLRATADAKSMLESHRDYVATLARASGLTIAGDGSATRGTVGTIADGVGVLLAVSETDRPRARKRLESELQAARAHLERTRRRLDDPEFTTRAPAEVVEEERRRDQELRGRERLLQRYLEDLG